MLNASSVAGLLLTTEALIADKPEAGGDAGGGFIPVVDSDSERGAMQGGVVTHHQLELKPLAIAGGHRYAYPSTCFSLVEIDMMRLDKLRRHHEVTLVLAVLVIDNDYEPSRLQVSYGILNG